MSISDTVLLYSCRLLKLFVNYMWFHTKVSGLNIFLCNRKIMSKVFVIDVGIKGWRWLINVGGCIDITKVSDFTSTCSCHILQYFVQVITVYFNAQRVLSLSYLLRNLFTKFRLPLWSCYTLMMVVVSVWTQRIVNICKALDGPLRLSQAHLSNRVRLREYLDTAR